MNNCSLNVHFAEFQQIHDQYQYKSSIMCLSETWLSIDQPFEHFIPKVYQPIFSVNSSKNNGIAMYIQENFSFEINEHRITSRVIWLLYVSTSKTF